jgi:AraC-like DNA-binding protein
MTSQISDKISRFFASLDSSASLLDLFDHLPDVYLYVKDAEGRFMKVNRTLVQARGLKSEAEILGKTDVDIHPKYWGLRYIEEDRRVIRSRQQLVDQVWLVPNAKGRLESFVSTKIPLFNRAGECIGIAGVRRPLHSTPASASSERRGIEAAVKTMTENYAESVEMNQLAQSAGLSHSQFNRRFRATYRMSPSTYLQRVRVHEACRRLTDGDQSISEISLETGFYDQAHLTRTFKKFLDITPTEFRRINNREIEALLS